VRGMGAFALLLLFAPASLAAPPELARGDLAWARRGDGQVDGKAAPQPIGAAIDAYTAAVAVEPRSLEASWKLVRALWFSANFASEDVTAKRSTYERARDESGRGFALLAERFGDRERFADATPDELRARLSPGDAHDAARLYFWSALNLGEWGRIAGPVEAIRAGVPNHLHQDALRSLALDPEVEQGGALRLLSRLHAEVPYLPLLFGWVDRAQAVPLAERAVARFPQHPWSLYILAEAILDTEPERRLEALSLLERTSALAPRLDHIVEDAAVRKAARERLQAERRASASAPSQRIAPRDRSAARADSP